GDYVVKAAAGVTFSTESGKVLLFSSAEKGNWVMARRTAHHYRKVNPVRIYELGGKKIAQAVSGQ
ncbi:hypothetical protein H0H81_008092, partial [Sphagnurus paluster]